MKKDYTYKTALRKQYTIVAFSLVLICVGGWYIFPLDTDQKTWAFALYIIVLGIAAIWYLRSTGISVCCDKCQTDIFRFIEAGKTFNKEIKFCPMCGAKLEI